MSGKRPEDSAGTASVSSSGRGARHGLLRDHLESLAIALLLVLVMRQMVVEAFKIPTGSMAPTLLGVHKEVRCPNCSYVFQLGSTGVSPAGTMRCPNCLHEWRSAGGRDAEVALRRPAWLWNEGRDLRTKQTVSGLDAANRINRWGSRIFVNKFIYTFRRPRRWEVIVFIYPGPTEGPSENLNYIKRLVGLPGEELFLQNGDVYVDGRIARKPPAVQERLWMHVLDSRFVPLQEVEPRWDFGTDAALWAEDKDSGGLELKAFGSEPAAMASFARPIRDSYAYNGVKAPKPLEALHNVGDVRIEVELTVRRAGPDAAVELQIEEDDHDFRLVVPVGGQRAELLDGGSPVKEGPASGLEAGRRVRLDLENYDDRVAAHLGDQTLIVHEYDGSPTPSRLRKRVALGAKDADVSLHSVKIQRDIYYQDKNGLMSSPKLYELDKESYFVLGDNSPDSKDSRYDYFVPEDNILGEAFAVFWPVSDWRLLSLGAQ